MECKLFVLALAALAVSHCDAKLETGNMFGVEYAEEIDVSKLQNRLTFRFSPDIQEVARLLAITKDKSNTVVGSIRVEQLVKIGEINSHFPLIWCRRYHFRKFEEICQIVSSNPWLSPYCKHCFQKQYEHCRDMGADQVFEKLWSNIWVKGFKDAMGELDTFITTYGEEEDPAEKNVRRYWARLYDEDRRILINGCEEMEREINNSLLYFNESGLEYSSYMRKLRKDQREKWDRCVAVNKLSKN